MSCYCVTLINSEINRLKQEMFRAVDKYGYNHPIVHRIASQLDPLVSSLTQVQLHQVRYKQAQADEFERAAREQFAYLQV